MSRSLFPTIRCLAVFAFMAAAGRIPAQDEKALRVYEALLKRPTAGVLFEQFYDAWLGADTVEALEKFLTARAEKSPESRMVLAVFQARQGQFDKAVEGWRSAVNDLPQRADAWLALAEIEGRLGNTGAALAAAESGLTAAASPELRRRLAEFKGRTLARNGAADEARKVWQALIAEQPRDEDLREDFIDLLTEAGDNDAAIKEARELAGATTDPYRRVLRRSKAGDLLARQDSGDEAVAEFRTALLDTGSGSWLEKDLLQRIEAVFRRADRAGDLSAFVAKLAAEQPQRLAVRRWLARLLAEEGNAEAADEVWRALVQSAPGDRELTEAFIRHLTDSARHAEAAAQWRFLIRLHPTEAELRLQLAAALHAAKDDAGCEAAVREFLTVSGETEEAVFRAASELGKFKLTAAVLAILESNIRRFPSSEQARMQFTSALHAAGKKEEAAAAWRSEAAREGRRLAAARAASAHGEHALTWELLAPHLDDFASDAPALQFICEAAMTAEKWEAGLAQARKLLALTSDPDAVAEMLALTLRIAAGGGLTESLRRDLESRRPQLSPAEACLLAQLLQSSGDLAAATTVLRDVSVRAPALGSALLVRLHAAAKEFSEAVRIQQALVESPGGRKAANVQRLVELCASAGRYTEALRWTEEWKKLAHGSTAPWLKEASLLADSGRLSEASRRLQHASRLWPDDEEVMSRLAAAQAAAGAPMDAQRSWLRLYERAESTSGKLRWLQPLMQNAVEANLLDDLAAEFERRRAQNRQSPVPLLALSELEGRRGNQRRRLELLWEAARLGQGDVVLLTRASEAAVAEGFLELAATMLADAAKLDKSDALPQQRAVLLLQLGREAEASGILTSLAAGIAAEDAAELAVALSQEGHVAAAAGFLQKVSSRFPAHYRLGWLSACLLDDADDVPAALEAYLRLAGTNFAPLPDALPRPVEFKDSLQEFESVLTPLPSDDPGPSPGADGENLAVYQAMEERPGLIERQSPSRTLSLHRVPGPPRQLRGWAAARSLELASWNGPEALAAVRNALLQSGVRGAIFAGVILSQQYVSLWDGYVAPDFASHPDDTGWILRLVLGAAPRQTDESNPLNQPEAGEPGFRPRRHSAALLAWRHFQKSDLPYAIDEALLLADSPVAEERAAAAEALRLVEARETPGPLLAGVLAHLTDAVATPNPAQGSLAEKLSGHLAAWHAAAPPGAERNALRDLRLQQLTNGTDPADFLDLMREEIASDPPARAQDAADEDEVPAQPSNPFAPPSNPFAPDLRRYELPGPGASLLTLPPHPVATGGSPGAMDGPLVRAAWRLEAGPWSQDAAKLRTALEHCSHQGLKALASTLLEDVGFTDGCMEELGKDVDASMESLRIAAAWEWRRQRPEKSVALLERLSALEPEQAPHDADTAILAAADLLLSSEQPVPDSIKAAARAAMVRLSPHPCAGDHSESLSALAESLSMADLAQSFSASVQQSRGIPAPPPIRFNPLPGFIAALHRPQGNGPKSQAPYLHQLLQAARETVEPEASPQPQLEQAENPGQGLPEALKTVLTKLAEESPHARIVLFAGIALLRHDEVAAATNAFRRACALAPESRKIRLLAARNLAPNSLPDAEALAVKLTAADRAIVLMDAVTGLRHGVLDDLDPALDVAGKWLAALREANQSPDHADDRVPDPAESDPTPALALLETNASGFDDAKLPAFLSREQLTPGQAASAESLSRLANRRRETLSGLYAELLRSPHSDIAFERIARAVASKALAWDSLPDEALARVKNQPEPAMPVFSGGTDVAADLSCRVLLEAAEKRPGWLDGTVLPELRAAGKSRLAADLARAALLRSVPAAEFLTSAGRAETEVAEEERFGVRLQAANIAVQRGLPEQLPALAEGILTVDSATTGAVPAIVTAAADQLVKSGGQPALDEWVQKLCRAPQPPDIWQRPASPDAIPDAAFQTLAAIIQVQGSNYKETFLTCLRLARAMEQHRNTLPENLRAAANIPIALPQPEPGTDPSRIVAILEAAGFLADVAEFRLWLPGQSPDGNTVSAFEFWTSAWSQGFDSERKAVLQLLERDYAKSFGGRLTAARLKDQPALRNRRSSMPFLPFAESLAVIGEALPQLKALPEDKQIAFSFLAINSGNARTRKPEGAALAADQWLSNLVTARWSRELDTFLTLPRISPQTLTVIVSKIYPEDPERVTRLLTKVSAAPGNQIHLPQIIDDSIRMWASNDSPELPDKRVRAVLSLMCGNTSWAPSPEGAGKALTDLFDEWLVPSRETVVTPELVGEALRAVEAVSPDWLTEGQCRALLPAAADWAVGALRQQEVAEWLKFVRAAAEQLAKPGPGGRVREVMAQAFALASLHFERMEAADLELQRTTGSATPPDPFAEFTPSFPTVIRRPGVRTESELPPPQSALHQFLTDVSLPVELRRFYAGQLAYEAQELIEPAHLTASVRLFTFLTRGAPGFESDEFLLRVGVTRAAAQFIPQDEAEKTIERVIVQILANVHGPDSKTARYAFLLAARSADDDLLRVTLRPFVAARDAGLAQIFRILVNCRRFIVARELLEDGAGKLFGSLESAEAEMSPGFDSADVPEELYMRETPKNLRDFLATLPDGPLRAAAEMLVETARDSPGLRDTGTPYQLARTLASANRLAAMDLPDEWAQRILMVFDQTPATLERLHPTLAKTLERITAPAALARGIRFQWLYRRYLEGEVMAARFASLGKALREIFTAPDSVRVPALEWMFSAQQQALWDHSDKWSGETLLACRELLRLTCMDARNLPEEKFDNAAAAVSDAQERLAFCAFIHAVQDSMVEFDTAWEALPEPARQRLRQNAQVAGKIAGWLFGSEFDLVGPGGVNNPDLPASRGRALARLLVSRISLPGLTPGNLQWFLRGEGHEIDPVPVLASVSNLLPRRDTASIAALFDLAILLSDAGRKEEAERCLPAAAEWVSLTSPTERVFAFETHFSLVNKVSGPRPPLTWALHNTALLAPGMDGDSPAIATLHAAMNLAGAALLQSSDPDKWESETLARLTDAPQSPLALFHAACALERIADFEAAAGRKEKALNAMSLAVLIAARAEKQQPHLLDGGSRMRFTANWASHARAAGRKVEVAELFPPGSEWVFQQATPGELPETSAAQQRGIAPLGWNAPDLKTTIEPDPLRPLLKLRARVGYLPGELTNGAGGPAFGCLYLVACGHDAPGFSVNAAKISWNDTGRPEHPFPSLAANPAATRIRLLEPRWLAAGMNELGFDINTAARKEPSLAFDAALYGLKLTFTGAVAAAEQIDVTDPPEFWKRLPEWIRK